MASFWTHTSFIGRSDHIKTLDEKGLKPNYRTCDLLALLHSPSWEDRARSLDFLMVRREKGVPEAALSAMADDHLEVAGRAGTLFSLLTGHEQDVFPDLDELRQWWAKEGAATTANFKPLACK